MDMLVKMGSLTTPEDLIAWCYKKSKYLPAVERNITNVRLHTDVVDKRARLILPHDTLVNNAFPIDTRGDGRCFLFAVSRLLFGYADEARVAELRVRIVIEGFVRKHEFMDHAFLARGMAGTDLLTSIPETLAELSGYYDDQNTMNDVSLIYNNMLWNYRRSHEVRTCNVTGTSQIQNHCSLFHSCTISLQEAGLWMFHIVANFFRAPIISTYPWMGAHKAGNLVMLEKRRIYNRIIYPREGGSNRPAVCIMWTRCDGKLNSEPNHFVPVVP